jgi:hypothetical protein
MDLSILPDDQLLQLIEAVTKEVARRAIAIQAATEKYWQDTKEEILNHPNNAASQRRASSPTSTNDDLTKATVARLLKTADFFRNYQHHAFSVNVWEKQGDIRVYLQESFKSDGWKFVYYHTGNRYQIPEAVSVPDDLDSVSISEFRDLARMLCNELPSGFKCYANDDIKHPVNSTLLQQYWSQI